MYMVSDVYSSWFASIYFGLCITICSYFLLNLTVAVMLDNFTSLHKEDSSFKKFF